MKPNGIESIFLEFNNKKKNPLFLCNGFFPKDYILFYFSSIDTFLLLFNRIICAKQEMVIAAKLIITD